MGDSERTWTFWRVAAVAGLALAYLTACAFSFAGALVVVGASHAAPPPAPRGALANVPTLHSEIEIQSPWIAAFWLLHVLFLILGVRWLRQGRGERSSELNLFLAFGAVTLVGGWILTVLAVSSKIRIDWLTRW